MLSAVLCVGLVGCVSQPTPNEAIDSEAQQAETAEVAEEGLVIPEGVSPQGVVLAAFLLANGDIARAVEEALVSPEEVELGREALATDTLQLWVDAASSKH